MKVQGQRRELRAVCTPPGHSGREGCSPTSPALTGSAQGREEWRLTGNMVLRSHPRDIKCAMGQGPRSRLRKPRAQGASWLLFLDKANKEAARAGGQDSCALAASFSRGLFGSSFGRENRSYPGLPSCSSSTSGPEVCSLVNRPRSVGTPAGLSDQVRYLLASADPCPTVWAEAGVLTSPPLVLSICVHTLGRQAGKGKGTQVTPAWPDNQERPYHRWKQKEESEGSLCRHSSGRPWGPAFPPPGLQQGRVTGKMISGIGAEATGCFVIHTPSRFLEQDARPWRPPRAGPLQMLWGGQKGSLLVEVWVWTDATQSHLEAELPPGLLRKASRRNPRSEGSCTAPCLQGR